MISNIFHVKQYLTTEWKRDRNCDGLENNFTSVLRGSVCFSHHSFSGYILSSMQKKKKKIANSSKQCLVR